jgi:N-acetylglutamate synthase-like GNAT family acetyltransferase
MTKMIRKATENDFDDIYHVINDAAMAYKGIIPLDRWHEPYMTREELKAQIDDGVCFYCYVDHSGVVGVMGLQDKGEVSLIRHAYVITAERKKGIGARLIQELLKDSSKPVLIGTWRAAHWAIRFYERHGFLVVSEEEKNKLLRKYWNIPDRQVEASIVLAEKKYAGDKYC